MNSYDQALPAKGALSITLLREFLRIVETSKRDVAEFRGPSRQ
jgi:hypothetical protein